MADNVEIEFELVAFSLPPPRVRRRPRPASKKAAKVSKDQLNLFDDEVQEAPSSEKFEEKIESKSVVSDLFPDLESDLPW